MQNKTAALLAVSVLAFFSRAIAADQYDNLPVELRSILDKSDMVGIVEVIPGRHGPNLETGARMLLKCRPSIPAPEKMLHMYAPPKSQLGDQWLICWSAKTKADAETTIKIPVLLIQNAKRQAKKVARWGASTSPQNGEVEIDLIIDWLTAHDFHP